MFFNGFSLTKNFLKKLEQLCTAKMKYNFVKGKRGKRQNGVRKKLGKGEGGGVKVTFSFSSQLSLK